MSPLHIFPFQLPADLDTDSVEMFGPQDRVGGAVLRGRDATTGEWFAAVLFERPTVWLDLARADKQAREATQLNRFVRDYKRATGADFGDTVGPGRNPPDLIVNRAGQETGIELTQLVYQDRIEAWEAMESIKRGLLEFDRAKFGHLSGLCVYVSYDRNQGLPVPGKRGARELGEALHRFKPNALQPQILVPGTFPVQAGHGAWSTVISELDHLEERLPKGTMQTFGRMTLMSVPLSRHAMSPLARQRGFDIALSVQTDVWESAAWMTFDKRVREKDRPGSDIILVTCGAPVIKGNSFPSDELAGQAVRAAAGSHALSPTTHARTVYLHSWASEQIAEFHPGAPGFTLLPGP